VSFLVLGWYKLILKMVKTNLLTTILIKNDYNNEEKIILIELYHKADHEKENGDRILKYFK